MQNRELEAQKWLEEHAALLSPEELPFEEEKFEEAMRDRETLWPIPRIVPHMGIFTEIKDSDSFDKIIGDPNNWRTILDRTDLFQSWIVPQAALIVGKTWFDGKQHRGNSMCMGPLRRHLFEKCDWSEAKRKGQAMEETLVGRSTIFKIICRIEHTLKMYLSGGGRASTGTIKNPHAYMIKAIINEFVRENNENAGFHSERVRACPNCMATRRGVAHRSEVVRLHDHFYRCDRCIETVRNIELIAQSKEISTELIQKCKCAKLFSEFSGIVFVCPNDKCIGRFVPANSVKESWWSTPEGLIASDILAHTHVLKGIQRFRDPPKGTENIPLECPFCGECFSPALALLKKSGFCSQSGKLTGLPVFFVQVKTIDNARTLDQKIDIENLHASMADKSIEDPTQSIADKKRIDILIGELAIRAQECGEKTTCAFMSKYFYLAGIDWMLKHPDDAIKYLFYSQSRDRELTDVEKGRTHKNTRKKTFVAKGDTNIHKAILYEWLKRITENLPKNDILTLEDLKWFCRPPTYNGGPKVVFSTLVQDELYIRNTSKLKALKESVDTPRMAWIVSIHKIGENELNLVDKIRQRGWQDIQMLAESGLQVGDRVRVSALFMPAHHCHTPIQRILRLRTTVLAPIIAKIKEEEAGQDIDSKFWAEWNKRAEKAKQALGYIQ